MRKKQCCKGANRKVRANLNFKIKKRVLNLKEQIDIFAHQVNSTKKEEEEYSTLLLCI